ncbi:MAG: DsrE family protein [Archaeoglobus sp.]|nr:DsrE family protein [Archaeoglobus sp.]
MRVVFHIDLDSTPTFELLLGNIRNLLKSVENIEKVEKVERIEIAVVANGYAVKLFTKPNLEKYAEEIETLVEKGVVFYVCNNALTNLVNVKPESISDLCEIIPAGVVKLIELQKKGYAYIKP